VSVIVPFTSDVAFLGFTNHSRILLLTNSIADSALRSKVIWLLIVVRLDSFFLLIAILINEFLRVEFLGSLIFFCDIDICHVDGSFALVKDKNISIDILNAIVVHLNIYSKEGTQKS